MRSMLPSPTSSLDITNWRLVTGNPSKKSAVRCSISLLTLPAA